MTGDAAMTAVPRSDLFPIQSQWGAKPHPLRIPWSVAEKAYSVYSARYGRDQSLERLAERGGFYPDEMDLFLPGWREEASEIAALRAVAREAANFQGFCGIHNWRTFVSQAAMRAHGELDVALTRLRHDHPDALTEPGP